MSSEARSEGTEAGDKSDLVRVFNSVVETITSNSDLTALSSASGAPAELNILVELENLGRIKVDFKIAQSTPALKPDFMPLTKADVVKKAKELFRLNDTYPRGCSEFVCKVLGIGYQQANDLMGKDPKSVGSGPDYPDLEPGDIAGWISTTGPGHVAVYIGEGGNNAFIDVREPGAKPRSKNGYYNHEMFKAPL